MPLKWFQTHRRSSSAGTLEDGVTRSSTETMTTKQKSKRNKSVVTQRSNRSHSHGSGLRAMIGLGRSTQHELDVAAAVEDAVEDQRRISYQTKTRRRFTIHGLSYHNKPSSEEAGWSCHTTPAGSPHSMYGAVTPNHAHTRHFGLASGRGQQMIPATLETAHPSIIFIDCPP
ncbi:unnamed protein product [Phytophthora fragariaefolia]|uniref:Unnamed protein product n=1 Tax=Phytophthora fragariaefolia TaxID=1490495 RepID=A0A9W6XLQ7_9STRA|nr:unnamed protein product [Phytophthora fragariaefolia]